MTTPKRATTHYIKSITIDSPRFEEEGGAIDVTAITPEINLYESLYSPYITGDLMIADTSGITNYIKASGQETVTIELYVDEDNPLIREFVIYAVRKQVKYENSSSSVYVYSLIEKHGFFSFFQRINRGYNGNIKDIIFAVYKNELFGAKDTDDETAGEQDIEKNMLKEANFERASQSVKIVSPNKTPLGLCMWLANRATSEYGEPFFLYSSLREGPQFRSLGSLLQQPSQNPTKPYRYSQVYTSVQFDDEIYRIFSLTIPEQDNSIALARSGAFGIVYQSIDPFFKTNDRAIYQDKFNQDDYFKHKKEAGRTLAEYNLYDDKFRIGPQSKVDADGNPVEGLSLAELNSQIHSQINTSYAFDDWNGFDEESDIGLHLNKVRRRSDLAFMQKQKMEIVIPGYNMLKNDTNTSIGKLIDIRIPSDMVQFQTPDPEQKMDNKKTSSGPGGGVYLVTKVRHRFSLDANYIASLEVAKMAAAQPLE